MPKRHRPSRRRPDPAPTNWGRVALVGFFAALIHLGPVAGAIWSAGGIEGLTAPESGSASGFAVEPAMIEAFHAEPEQVAVGG